MACRNVDKAQLAKEKILLEVKDAKLDIYRYDQGNFKSIDKFDKKDRFVFNILSCAMLSAILLNLDFDPAVEEVREYYRLSMMTNKIMKFTKKEIPEKGRNRLKKSAEWSKSNNNPYSWKFDVEDGASINEYTATFHTCGICYLMKKV